MHIPFGELRDIVGKDAALKMCRHFGGREIYVPLRLDALHDEHSLCKIVGRDVAELLVASNLSGLKFSLPFYNSKRERMSELYLQGKSASEIARLCNCTTRNVYINLRAIREDMQSQGKPFPSHSRPSSSESAGNILALLQEGVTLSEAMEKTGLTRSQIFTRCWNMRSKGIEVPDFVWDSAKEFGDLAHQVLAEKRRGLSVPEIARKLKVPLADVSRAHKALRDDGIWMPVVVRQRPRATGTG